MSRPMVSRNQRTVKSQEERPPAVLPPYQPLAYPLADKGKRDLAAIIQNHDFRRYTGHIKRAIDEITGTAADAMDRYESQKRSVEKRMQRHAQPDSPHEKTVVEEQSDERLEFIGKRAEELVTDAEKAVRDIIDIQEELAQQTLDMRKINENIAAAPAINELPRRRPAAADLDDEYADQVEPVEAEEMPANILSPAEMLRSAKQEHTALWNAKSMRARYTENNDYKGFKGVIHNSKYPGENAPPVPHARTWFPEDADRFDPKSEENPDEDDDIIIKGLTLSLKCPLTLQMLNEPYSNKKCPHVFEKYAILEYHNQNAVAFQDGRRERNQRSARQLQCPQTGCHAMLELGDFYVDTLMVRQVKRAREEERIGESDDEVDEYSGLPHGSRRRPEEIDDDEVQNRRRTIENMKKRASTAKTSSAIDEDSNIEMGEDD